MQEASGENVSLPVPSVIPLWTAHATASAYHISAAISENEVSFVAEGRPAARHSMVTIWAREHSLSGEKVVREVPAVISIADAHATA